MTRIIYISGSRAEYGIMKNLLLKFHSDPDIHLTIVATGMHCEKEYGETYKIIEEDGLTLSKLVPIQVDTSSNASIIKSMSICQQAFGYYFEENKFDAVIILGDRYEIFSVAVAAAMQNLPIIHLHGGEKTLGNYDEFIRHSITKMSRLHLASTEIYKKRIIQLGENPSNVHNIGALGAENSLLMDLPSKDELERNFGSLNKPYFMVVYHPETLSRTPINAQLDELLNALSEFSEKYNFIFIGSNSDTGSDIIREKIIEFCHKYDYKYLVSVKVEEYLALNKYSYGLIGNSSSGLIEIPSLKVPTINIGDRQKGRVRGESVIDTECIKDSIVSAIKKSSTNEYRAMVNNSINPYYKGSSIYNAYNVIKKFISDNSRYELKDFFDQ